METLTDGDKRGIELLLAGAIITGGEHTFDSIRCLYGEEGVRYAEEYLAAPEM